MRRLKTRNKRTTASICCIVFETLNILMDYSITRWITPFWQPAYPLHLYLHHILFMANKLCCYCFCHFCDVRNDLINDILGLSTYLYLLWWRRGLISYSVDQSGRTDLLLFTFCNNWNQTFDNLQTLYKKLSYRRETARRFLSLNILLSYSRSFKTTLLSRACVSPY